MAPVTFTNIEIVNITNAAGSGSLTLMGMSGQANAMSLVGTGQGAGIATLNGVPISFSGMTSFSYQGGGERGAGDTITVTPFVTSQWNLAVMVAGGSGTPASLTYNSVDSLADTVTATGADRARSRRRAWQWSSSRTSMKSRPTPARAQATSSP